MSRDFWGIVKMILKKQTGAELSKTAHARKQTIS